MADELKDLFWQFIDHWQTLIAGGLALLAGVGTVWATINSAKNEIAAAQKQTRAAQDQTAAMLRLERRRLAREEHSFLTTLIAAMETVVEDVQAARHIARNENPESTRCIGAFEARQRMRKTAFAELRGAILRLGGQLSLPFLRLDNEIENCKAHWSNVRHPSNPSIGLSSAVGLRGQLEQIERQAAFIRDEAAQAAKLCIQVLLDTEDTVTREERA